MFIKLLDLHFIMNCQIGHLLISHILFITQVKKNFSTDLFLS